MLSPAAVGVASRIVAAAAIVARGYLSNAVGERHRLLRWRSEGLQQNERCLFWKR